MSIGITNAQVSAPGRQEGSEVFFEAICYITSSDLGHF